MMTMPNKMQAIVYGGPGVKSFDTVPTPKILQPTDAIIKIVKT